MIQSSENNLEDDRHGKEYSPSIYIHPSESPNKSLAKAPLNGGNYYTWSREVRRTLGSKNKLCFINGKTTVVIPKFGEKYFDAWKQENDMVITWLYKSTNSSIKQSVIWINTAREVSKDLSKWYDREDAYRLLDLVKAFHCQK